MPLRYAPKYALAHNRLVEGGGDVDAVGYRATCAVGQDQGQSGLEFVCIPAVGRTGTDAVAGENCLNIYQPQAVVYHGDFGPDRNDSLYEAGPGDWSPRS